MQPELRWLFMLIARKLDGRPLHPTEIVQMAPGLISSMPGHAATISYRHKASSRDRSKYTIVIVGPRTDGKWTVQAGEFCELVKQAAAFPEFPDAFVPRPKWTFMGRLQVFWGWIVSAFRQSN